MLDDKLAGDLGLRLYELRENRLENPPPAEDLNDLIADIMNGLETLFILINARVSQESNPQGTQAVFRSVSNPSKPTML